MNAPSEDRCDEDEGGDSAPRAGAGHRYRTGAVVLSLMARRLTNAEIANERSVGDAIVKIHVPGVLHKLDLRDHVQAGPLSVPDPDGRRSR